jgi:hypothetical protein
VPDVKVGVNEEATSPPHMHLLLHHSVLGVLMSDTLNNRGVPSRTFSSIVAREEERGSSSL